MGSRLLAKARNSIVSENGVETPPDTFREIPPAPKKEHSSRVGSSASLRSKAGQLKEDRESRSQAQNEYFTVDTSPALPNVLIIHPNKPLQIETVQYLHDELRKAIEAFGFSNLILVWDFTTVENIDAAGVGMLIAVQKKLREQGGDQALSSLRPRLFRYIAMLGYADYFCIEPDIPHVIDRIEAESAGVFPLSSVCPACGFGLRISEAGRGRCRSCGAILSVFSDGSIELG